MNSLFIYHWLFRILSPIFSGVAVYALILLSYGDFDTSFEAANTPELYLCIVLALIVQELTILLFRRFGKNVFDSIEPIKLITAGGKVLLIGLIATTAGLALYYHLFLGYLPAREEVILFNTIYAILIILYITIYLSHGILDIMASHRIQSQLEITKSSEEDFNRLIQDINPELLTTGLESVIAHLDSDEDKADHIVIQLSKVYRYLLSKRKQQIVPVEEEIHAAKELVSLYNNLPFRHTEITALPIYGYVIPGTIIHLIEEILKNTISGSSQLLSIEITEENEFIYITYRSCDKLSNDDKNSQLERIRTQYRLYSERTLNTYSSHENTRISIPILTVSK